MKYCFCNLVIDNIRIMKKLAILLFTGLVIAGCNNNQVGYTTPVIDPTPAYNNRSVGASAHDFLSQKNFQAINLEIAYSTSKFKLEDEVINEAKAFITKYCRKPYGVKVYQQQLPMLGNSLAIDQLTAIENIYRKRFTSEGQGGAEADTISIFILVTDGTYIENNVLGIAYRNTSVSLFGAKIRENSGGVGQPSENMLTATVLKHEIGHLLGLVNSGSEMQTNHQDGAHGKHCDNKDCLMYYTMQTTDLLSVLLNQGVPVLDANCEDDLRANGGK